MNQFDSVLRIYAESGLRTTEDWATSGRDVTLGSKPRLDTPYRGALVSLFSRDQTHIRAKSRAT